MNGLIICVSFALAAFANGASINSRIVGGEQITAERVPYTVSLEFVGEYVCGGAILSEDRVLVTAGCIEGEKPSEYQVRAGANKLQKGGQLLNAARFIIHPQFISDNKDYDIAIVVTKEKFIFNAQVQPVKLPASSQEFKGLAVISGFGSVDAFNPELSENLMATDLALKPREECKTTLGLHFTERMICAGTIGKDACYGDFGAPLVQNNVLIGLNSWGISCNVKGYPRAFSNVSSYINFINNAL